MALLRPSPPSRIIPAQEAWNQTASGDGISSQRVSLNEAWYYVFPERIIPKRVQLFGMTKVRGGKRLLLQDGGYIQGLTQTAWEALTPAEPLDTVLSGVGAGRRIGHRGSLFGENVSRLR